MASAGPSIMKWPLLCYSVLWSVFTCFCQVWAEVDSVSLRGTQEQSSGRCVGDNISDQRQQQQQQPCRRRRQFQCRLAAVTTIERSVVSCNSFHCRPMSPLRPTHQLTVRCSAAAPYCAQMVYRWPLVGDFRSAAKGGLDSEASEDPISQGLQTLSRFLRLSNPFLMIQKGGRFLFVCFVALVRTYCWE